MSIAVLLSSCTKEEDLVPVCNDQCGNITVSYSYENDCTPFEYSYNDCSKTITYTVNMYNQCDQLIYTHEFIKQYTSNEWYNLRMTAAFNEAAGSQRQAVLDSFTNNYDFNNGDQYCISDFNSYKTKYKN